MEPKHQQLFAIVSAIVAVIAIAVAFWSTGTYSLKEELIQQYKKENAILSSQIHEMESDLKETRNALSIMNDRIGVLLIEIQALRFKQSRERSLLLEDGAKPTAD